MENLPREIREGLHPLVFCVNLIPPNNSADSTDSTTDLVQAFQNSPQQRFLHPTKIFAEFVSSLSGFQTTLAGVPSNPDTTPWAHIVKVSKRHVFPPSKDPEGTQNRSTLIVQSRSSTTTLYTTSSSQNTPTPKSNVPPLEGILPAGWLEKHAHALPAVLIVVTYIDITMDPETAEESDLELAETIDQLRSSLALKRECRMHLICCVLPPPTTTPDYNDDPFEESGQRSTASNPNNNSENATMDAERFVSIRTKCRLTPSNITTLQVSPNGLTLASLSTPLPYSDPDLDYEPQQQKQNLQQKYIQQQLQLKRLHRNIQDSANSYYLNLARRAKHKLSALYVEQYPEHLPLAARYCFKIASFYEFQNHTPGLNTSDKILQYRTEGYQYLEEYYQELMEVLESGGTAQDIQSQLTGPTTASGEGDVEVALANSPLSSKQQQQQQPSQAMKSISFEDDPHLSASSEYFLSDLVHQCRTLASWCNFQIIQMAHVIFHKQNSKHPFVYKSSNRHSHPQLVLAQTQWQRYYYTFLSSSDNDPLFPKWYHLFHICQERYLMAQLSEGIGLAGDGILPCCTWKMYEAASDTRMELHRELILLRQSKSQKGEEGETKLTKIPSSESLERHNYVGGFGKDRLETIYQNEMEVDHLGFALRDYQKALSHFKLVESELHVLAEKQVICTRNRSRANIHFRVGGLLLYRKQYAEAKNQLEQALHQSDKWSGLQCTLMKAIQKCQEHLTQTEKDLYTHASMILNSSIFRFASPKERDIAMDAVFFPSKETALGAPLSVTLSTSNTTTNPFTFAATFPKATHAVAGDTVTASVSLKSHLLIPVSISSMQLQTTVGLVTVGKDPCNVIIQPNTVEYFSAEIKLPLDLVSSLKQEEVPEVSANLKPTGKPQNIPVGSVGKNIKVRTSGLTQGGGAYYLTKPPDQEIGSVLLDNTLFGGVPISCTGIILSLNAVKNSNHAESGTLEIVLKDDKPTIIQESSDKDKLSQIKHLPVFEKVNYVDIAWDRPMHHSLSLGPRCIRVLKPIPKLKITNITALQTEGRAMEGVVNRIIFKVESGSDECCSDVEYSIRCTNSNILPMPSDNKQGKVDRPPILVIHDTSSEQEQILSGGAILPNKWKPHPSTKSQGSKESYHKLTSTLEPEKSCLLVLDLFRPSPSFQVSAKADCQTNIELVFRYKQVLTMHGETGGIVTRIFKDSVVWNTPMKAKFSVVQGKLKAFPCGSSHPSNKVSSNPTNPPERDIPVVTVDPKSHISANNGDKITVRCSLEATEAQYGMGTEVQRVYFKVNRYFIYFFFLEHNM